MEAYETFEHAGVTVELHADTDAGDPYDQMEQASELLTFEQLHRDGFGSAFPVYEDGRELPVLARWLTLFGGYAVAIPFTFHDYGSGGYRASLVGLDSDRAAGFVVVAREKVAEEWPNETTIDDETFSALEMAERCARAEFETWAAWLEGDVHGYVVADGTPEHDSCWGFYGPGDEHVREEAKAAALWAAYEKAKREAKLRTFLLDPSPPVVPSWETFKQMHEEVAV
jgi:hypothetical protein